MHVIDWPPAAGDDPLRTRAAALEAENAVLRAQNTQLHDQLLRARAEIADLKRQLFGAKAERLTPEQEAQLPTLEQDLIDRKR